MNAPPISVHRELARKTLHLLAAVAPLAYAAGVMRTVIVAGLAAAVVVAIAVEFARRTNALVQRVLDRVVGPLFRAHEHASITGATWLMMGMLGAAVALPRELAIATMWAAAVGDPSAALVGRTLGRLRVHRDGKSLEGSLACLSTMFAGGVLVAGLPVAWSAVAGLAAAIAEWPASPFDDNLRIAVGVGATLAALRMFAA